MSQPNGHSTHVPADPDQDLLRRSPRSTITLLLVALSGGSVGGYSAARVEQSTHAPRRALRPPAADECGGCSPPCTKTQTCYRCTCVDVATSHHLRLRDLEERVQQLAGGDGALSAGAVR